MARLKKAKDDSTASEISTLSDFSLTALEEDVDLDLEIKSFSQEMLDNIIPAMCRTEAAKFFSLMGNVTSLEGLKNNLDLLTPEIVINLFATKEEFSANLGGVVAVMLLPEVISKTGLDLNRPMVKTQQLEHAATLMVQLIFSDLYLTIENAFDQAMHESTLRDTVIPSAVEVQDHQEKKDPKTNSESMGIVSIEEEGTSEIAFAIFPESQVTLIAPDTMDSGELLDSGELEDLKVLENCYSGIRSNPFVEQFRRIDTQGPQEVEFSVSPEDTLQLHQYLSKLKKGVEKACSDVLLWSGSGEPPDSGKDDDFESSGSDESGQEGDPETLVVWNKVSQVRNFHSLIYLEPANLLTTFNPDIPQSTKKTMPPRSKVLSHNKAKKKSKFTYQKPVKLFDFLHGFDFSQQSVLQNKI